MDSAFVSQLESIRRLVAESLAPPELPAGPMDPFDLDVETGDGWSISKVDPAGALRYFPHLRLKRGWKLVGLEFRSGNNGNGIVYAVPASATVDLNHAAAAPLEYCPGVVLEVPRPPDAASSFVDAIESNGHFEAYLQASILFREFQEFGARWHGCSWSTHSILFQDPWSESSTVKDEVGNREDWSFKGRSPVHWSPAVERSTHAVTVTFYSVSRLGQASIYRHEDRYRPPCLLPTIRETVIATGRDGFVF